MSTGKLTDKFATSQSNDIVGVLFGDLLLS